MNKADMPTGVDEPGAEPEQMSNEEMKAALKKAMETIAAQKKTIKTQKRNISEMQDANLKHKTLPSKKMAESKNPKKKSKGKKAKGKQAKSKKKKTDTSEEESSEHSDGGWNSGQSETEESEEEEQSEILDIQKLYNTVVEYCDRLMKRTTVPAYTEDQIDIKRYIDFHFENCKTYAEKRVRFTQIGLEFALEFIRTTMMEALAGDMQTIDVEAPENCQICDRPEVTLEDDESNFHEVVFECGGRFETPCGMVSNCQSAICFGCSNMPDTWRPGDDFWCLECNTPEKIATSKKISEKQKPVDVWSKPEKPPEKLNAAMQVVDVFGGGGGVNAVTFKQVRKLFKYKPSRQVTIEEVNRCGKVVKVGDFHESRKRDTPRPLPPKTVEVIFLKEFNPPDAIKGWNKTTMLVHVIEAQIQKYFDKALTYQKAAKKAICEINTHLGPKIRKLETILIKNGVKEIKKEMENLPLNQDKKKALKKKKIALNRNIQKALAIEKARLLPKIEVEVKKQMWEEMHNVNQITKMMANISELRRIVRNTANKTKLDEWDKLSENVWKFLECDYLKDEEFSDDDESEDNDDAYDDMVNDNDNEG